MNINEDPGLKNVEKISSLEGSIASIDDSCDPLDYLDQGFFTAKVTEAQANFISDFFNDLYQKIDKKKNRQITRNAAMLIKGAVFALGTKNINVQWKEHCAGSLREIFHEWYGCGRGFVKELREIYPNCPKSNETVIYNQIKRHYQYFSSISHHNDSGIMWSLISIMSNSTLGKDLAHSDKIFLERVEEFLVLLKGLIDLTTYSK